jgi:FkbM family methyltransferase
MQNGRFCPENLRPDAARFVEQYTAMKNRLSEVKAAIAEKFPSAVSLYRSGRRLFRKKTDGEVVADCYKRLNRKLSDIFFVEIGAMDGAAYDPLHEFVARYGWRGLLVEPLADMFEQLRRTYEAQRGLIFENVAIFDTPGQKTLFRVRPEAVEAGLVPPWAKGISSFYVDRNALGGEGILQEDFERIRPCMVGQTVVCETLAGLFNKHKITKIDVFQVDVEGYDYHVLKQMDFDLYRPYVIQIEWCNLPEVEKRLALDLLKRLGYQVRYLSCDLLAWRRDHPKPRSQRQVDIP